MKKNEVLTVKIIIILLFLFFLNKFHLCTVEIPVVLVLVVLTRVRATLYDIYIYI